MGRCWDLWPADCEALARGPGPVAEWLQQTVSHYLWAWGKAAAAALVPNLVELAGGAIAFCFVGCMVFGNPRRWLKYASVIFVAAVVWVVVAGG